jgi:hypothetical protein
VRTETRIVTVDFKLETPKQVSKDKVQDSTAAKSAMKSTKNEEAGNQSFVDNPVATTKKKVARGRGSRPAI